MTELNPTPTEEQVPAEDNQRLQNATRGAVLSLVANVIVTGFFFFQAWQQGAWQLYLLAGLVTVLFVATIASLRLIREGRLEFGVWIGIIAPLVVLLAIGLLISNMGVIAGIAMVILIFAKATQAAQTLTARKIRQVQMAGIGMGLLTAVQDLFNFDFRLPAPGIQALVPILLVGFLLGLGFFGARQAWRGSIRAKITVPLALAVFVALGIYSYVLVVTTQTALTNQVGESFASRAENHSDQIVGFFQEDVGKLQTLALSDVLRESINERNSSYFGSQTKILAEIQALDEAWVSAVDDDPLIRSVISNNSSVNPATEPILDFLDTFPEHAEVFVTDRYGATISASGRLSDYYQADESWWQATWNDGQGAIYISEPEYDESIGATALLIGIPITDHTGEVSGVLRSTLVVAALEALISDDIFGESGHAVLFNSAGSVIFDPRADTVNSAELPLEMRQEIVGEDAHFDVTKDQHSTDILFGHAPVQSNFEEKTYSESEQAILTAVNTLGWTSLFRQDTVEALAVANTQIRTMIIMAIVINGVIIAILIGLAQLLVAPLLRLTGTAKEIVDGDLSARANVETGDEIGILANTFNTMTSQLQETLQGLEQRVAERTQNLELAAEVGRSVSQVRALDIMLQDACELIQKEFDLYYTQVYLTNPSQTALQLQAGTGEVGAQLRERGHSLQLNTGSINGRAAMEKRTVVISDTAQSATFQPNPLLPDTRGEMAVPLIVGQNVVGVLDMQTINPGKLNEEILPAFEALAGQLAVAIQNANLLAEAEAARAEVETQARRLVRASWDEHLDAIHKPERIGFAFNQREITPLGETDVYQPTEEDQAVSAPIALTGETLGSLVVEIDEEKQNEHTGELVHLVARQIAQQIENLRLLESAERYRYEAEQAARRQTREGWQEYIQSRTEDSLGYIYNLNEVRPHSNGKDDPEALTLPLKARDETVGKLSVKGLASDDKESFDLANAVAERLGAHIESLRLFEETKQGQVELDRRAQQLAAVAEISTASSQELDISKLLETVANLTKERFNLYHAHVYLLNETADILKLAAGAGDVGKQMVAEGWQIPVGHQDSIIARTARTRQSVITNDIVHDKDSEFLSNRLLPDTRSEMAVPLMVGDKVLGVFDVQSDRINAFTEEDANIQTTLASQVATALQNARSFTQAQKQAERETMLNTINQKIQGATSVEAVLQIAARELGHALGAPMTVAQLSIKDQE